MAAKMSCDERSRGVDEVANDLVTDNPALVLLFASPLEDWRCPRSRSNTTAMNSAIGTADLLVLQNHIKRDRDTYRQDFTAAYRHYQTLVPIIQSTDDVHHIVKDFSALVSFLSHTTPHFGDEPAYAEFPAVLLTLIGATHLPRLPPELRLAVLRALILLCNRGVVSRYQIIPPIIHSFAVNDKGLRIAAFDFVVNDIKRANAQRKSLQLNANIQTFIGALLQTSQSASAAIADASSPVDHGLCAKKCVDVLIELWRRRIWNDERTAEIIANCAFHQDQRVMATALHFFIGDTYYDEEDGGAAEKARREAQRTLTETSEMIKGVTKKKKRRQRVIDRAQKKLNRSLSTETSTELSVSGITLLRDPQSFAERLFTRLRNSAHAFTVRLLFMNVISRIIGTHRLLIFNFYPFLQRFITPHQRHVTNILAFTAQATHPQLPPDVLRPIIQHLANAFVSDRSSPEIMQTGINAIREICARSPLSMSRTLLLDLSEYKKHKSKGVMMASRSLIALYRDVHPLLLHRRERGKVASLSLAAGGQQNNADDKDAEVFDDSFAMEDVASDLPYAEQLFRQEAEETAKADDNHVDNEDGSAHNEDDDEDIDIDDDDNDDEVDDDNDDDEDDGEGEDDEFDNDEDEGDANDADEAEASTEDRSANVAPKAASTERADDNSDAEADNPVSIVTDGRHLGLDDIDEFLQKLKGGGGDGATSGVDQSPTAEKTGDTQAVSKLPYAATRIFTDEDFARMRVLQLADVAANHSRKKRKRDGDDDLAFAQEVVDARESIENVIGRTADTDAITGYRPKKRLTKQDRLDSVIAGRQSRVPSSALKGGGSTNAEKARLKPFVMSRRKAAKQARANEKFTVAQARAQKHIVNLKRQSKRTKRKIKAKRGF